MDRTQVNWYLKALKNWSHEGFRGRARRKEYWMYFLFSSIIAIIVYVIDYLMKTPLLQVLYGVSMFVPGMSVCVRRLHDVGRSAWWLLISLVPLAGSIVLLVFTVRDSQPGKNKYGPNPKAVPGLA